MSRCTFIPPITEASRKEKSMGRAAFTSPTPTILHFYWIQACYYTFQKPQTCEMVMSGNILGHKCELIDDMSNNTRHNEPSN